ncbi:MAG: HAD-IA family hydrolase [Minisyncoccales bacterium]
MKFKKKSLKNKNPIKKKKIKAIIFDIGGVLQLINNSETSEKSEKNYTGVHSYVSEKFGLTIDQYFDSIDWIYLKSFTGELSKNKTINLMAEHLKTTPEKIKKTYYTAYKKNFKLNKELLIKAKELKKSGYKTVILSDIWPLAKDVLVIDEFYKTFDLIVLSCDIKLRKPFPEIFKTTLSKLNIKNSEAVFIDNQPWNTKTSQKLGINTILFKNNKHEIKELNNKLKI